jgi:hypothetical protein
VKNPKKSEDLGTILNKNRQNLVKSADLSRIFNKNNENIYSEFSQEI